MPLEKLAIKVFPELPHSPPKGDRSRAPWTKWIFSIQTLDLIPSSGAQRILQANGFRT
jgi:hypothetical protein